MQVVGIAVYSGSTEDVSKVVAKYNLNYPVVVGDEELVQKMGVLGYPTYFLIKPNGKIYKKYVGEVKNLYSQVKDALFQINKSQR